MPFLLRTFTGSSSEKPYTNKRIIVPQNNNTYIGYDSDYKYTFGQDSVKAFSNAANYNAHAAIGYNDPIFSLFPLATIGQDYKTIKSDISNYYDVNEFYEALPEAIKQGDLYKTFKHANEILKYHSLNDFGTSDFGELEDIYGVYPELLVELNKDLPKRERDKYIRILSNLRHYGPPSPSYVSGNASHDVSEYDEPIHALIEAPIEQIETANDKLSEYSAEQDGPYEYRVHDYTVKGLWTPRHVDEKIKKYFPKYNNYLDVNEINDNDRARDALADIIQMDPDGILSDKTCKNIISDMNRQLNSTYVNDNIVSVCTRRY